MFADLSYVKKLLYPAPPSGPASAEEIESRKTLKSAINGTIIFDSNRDGNFGIYEFDLETGQILPLVAGDVHAIYPDVCGVSGSIVFAQAQATGRLAPSNIWLLKNGSESPEQIALNGTFPTFSYDGSKVYFERERKELIQVDLHSGNEIRLFPSANANFGDFALVKPRISPDGNRVLFTSDKGGRWHLWCADLRTDEAHQVVKGCEGTWFPDNERAAWIRKYGLLGNVGIYSINAVNLGPISVLQDDPPPLGHEYFPWINRNGAFILYSACPSYEHDHLSAKYQLFARHIDSGAVTRISFDTFTNRWPKVKPLPSSR